VSTKKTGARQSRLISNASAKECTVPVPYGLANIACSSQARWADIMQLTDPRQANCIAVRIRASINTLRK